jgi:hypothetical protein
MWNVHTGELLWHSTDAIWQTRDFFQNPPCLNPQQPFTLILFQKDEEDHVSFHHIDLLTGTHIRTQRVTASDAKWFSARLNVEQMNWLWLPCGLALAYGMEMLQHSDTLFRNGMALWC